MKKNNLHNINKTGFKAPKGYFDDLEDSMMNQIKLRDKVTETGFKAPDGYFDALEGTILAKTKEEPKVFTLFSKQNLMYAASIAAVLVLMFNVFWNGSNSSSTIDVADIEQYLLQQDINEYELASLLTEDELITNNFIDTNITEESLEDYLLENATLEDLISE